MQPLEEPIKILILASCHHCCCWYLPYPSNKSVFPNFFVHGPFLALNITNDPRILAHVNSVQMIGTKN
jgi:hypothetical protein